MGEMGEMANTYSSTVEGGGWRSFVIFAWRWICSVKKGVDDDDICLTLSMSDR